MSMTETAVGPKTDEQIEDELIRSLTNQKTTKRSDKPKQCTRTLRFNSGLLVVLTLAISQILLQMIGPSIITAPFIIFIVLFSHEWNYVHLTSLSRVRRAYFDVSNVLETYQPRARTHGHLFQPDPPTPGVVKFTDNPEDSSHDSNNPKNAAFNKNRDAHYANMFEYATKMAKEMEALENSNPSPTAEAPKPSDDQQKSSEDKKPSE